MKETFELLKMNTINTMNSGKTKGKLGKAFLAIFFLLLMISIFMAAMSICEFFKEKETESYYLVFPAMIGFGMIYMLLITTYKAKSVLFGFKDIDLLFSLPIKESSILSYKIIDMMSFNYIVSIILFVPTALVYILFQPVNLPVYILFGLIVLIFVPLIPTLISGAFGYIIGFITSKTKYKSVVELVVSVAIIVIYTQLTSKIGNILEIVLETETDLELFVKDIFYPLYLVQDAMANQNIFSLLQFVLINVISFAIFVFLVKRSFTSINRKMKESISSKNFKMSELNQQGQIKSLFKKEFGLYTKSATYMLNTCFGAVCMMILSITSIFTDLQTLLNNAIASSDFPIQITGIQVLSLVCGTMAMLSCTTPDSISMESKGLWITKEMPVKETDIFLGKMLVDIAVILPVNLVATIILSITFRLKIYEALLLYLLVIAAGISMTQFGLMLNLRYPKLSFNADTEVIKESISAKLAVYIPIAIAFILSLIYAVIPVPFIIYLVILDILFIALAITMNIVLKTKGIKLFKELYC